MDDVLGFCDLLNISLGQKASTFALAAQRGYRRVSLTGVPPGEAWRALGAVCLWRAVCHPKEVQFVMAGTNKSGENWIRFLSRMCSAAQMSVRTNILFSQDKESVFVGSNTEPSIVVLRADTMNHEPITLGKRAKRTILVVPSFDRVPTRWMSALNAFTSGPSDQWLVVLPD